MIVADRKPIEEIKAMLNSYQKILIVGCGTCVSVCMAGGEKEVGILASLLKMSFQMDGKEVQIEEATVERQCDQEYIVPLLEKVKDADVVISMACGAGVQFMAELCEDKPVVPALNTNFIGVAEAEGEWGERCRACGDCVLASTGGICPVAMCAKSLLNGPCGGTNNGKCEVDKEKDCAWTLIYNRLDKLGKLDDIREIFPPKKHSAQTHPSKQISEAYQKGEKVDG